jgi:hypothetical protein
MDTYQKEVSAKGLPAKEVLDFVNQRLNDVAQGKFTSKYIADGQ